MGLRYVALGDSYTIGTSVAEAERWPNQLVAALDGALALVANPAVNGYTSADVIHAELPVFASSDPQFASLLVGVNDVLQGVPEPTYAANVATILDALLGRIAARRIVCVATPDYTLTPARRRVRRAGGAQAWDRAHERAARRCVPDARDPVRG